MAMAAVALLVVHVEAVVELVLALLELFFADRVAEDEVVDVVAEERHLGLEAVTARAQCQVEPQGLFGAQVGVADLEGVVADVRAKEVELFERRRPRRARHAGRNHEVVVGRGRPNQQAGGRRPLGEVARRQAALGCVARAVHTAAELQRGVRPGHFFVEERRRAGLIDRGRQRLLALGLERAVQEPAADAAHQGAHLLVREQQLALDGVVAEDGAHLVTLELGVLVVAHAERGAIRLQPPTHLPGAGAGRDGMARRRQADDAFLDDGDAVFHVVVAVAGAHVGVLPRPRTANLPQHHSRLRVVHRALGRVVVARAVGGAAEVEGKFTVAHVQVARAASRAAVAAEVEREVARRPLLTLGGNLVGDHVDEAADGAGAVQQRGGAAHHFDALGGGGVHGHAVIARLARQVAHALTVLEHRHAVAIQPADDRS